MCGLLSLVISQKSLVYTKVQTRALYILYKSFPIYSIIPNNTPNFSLIIRLTYVNDKKTYHRPISWARKDTLPDRVRYLSGDTETERVPPGCFKVTSKGVSSFSAR